MEKTMNSGKYSFLLLAASLIGCAACSTKSSETGAPSSGSDADAGTPSGWPAGTADAVSTYSRIVEASYADSISTAATLNGALEALVGSPSEATLDAAKVAWLASREPYLQTEVYRFYEGPIDNEEDGPEGLLNAWPLDEHYIDYTTDRPNGGMVNDASVTIDAATLEAANEFDGDANIATGYHAVEFLLWGQDLDQDGPGARPYTDYVTDGSGTAANQDRRGLYLTTVGDMMVTHLNSVHTQWTEGASYRTNFEADTAGAVEKILTGMIILSGFETGGERLQAALDSKNQEEEHSCFSDNTHRDMIQDVQGIWNVWHGVYKRTDESTVSGTSIKEIVAEFDADLAARVTDQIDTSLELANAMPVPFDQAISEGNVDGNNAVQALVQSLRDQEGLLQDVFDTLGLSVEIPTE